MQTKLFIGTRVTPDLKARLWEVEMGAPFQFIPFEGKEYVGVYIDASLPTVRDLKHRGTQLMDTLQKCLPDLRTDNLPLVVFPQLFLG